MEGDRGKADASQNLASPEIRHCGKQECKLLAGGTERGIKYESEPRQNWDEVS